MDKHLPKCLRPVFPEDLPAEAVRGKLLELLGIETVPEKCDFTIESEEQTADALRLIHLNYGNSLGEIVSGILTVPLDAKPQSLAGIVCMPETDGDIQKLTHHSFGQEGPSSGALVGWGRELARKGFATLSISLKGCRGRGCEGHSWLEEAKILAPYGRTQMGLMVEEAIRAACILGVCEWVDTRRIGLAGFSLGGNATWYAMACSPCISAGVVICGGLGSMAKFIRDGNVKRHSPYFFIPNLLRHFDHPTIVTTCICPRPLMVVAPTADADMPLTAVSQLIDMASPAYESAGCKGQFQVYQPQGNHAFPAEYFHWMTAWFQQFLGKNRSE